MTCVELTPSTLMVSLEQLASAKTEQECATALVASATLIQSAVLARQPAESFHAALSTCPAELNTELAAVLDRAVNFHVLEDGGTLGLWLLPVVLSSDQQLPSILPLENTSLNAMKLSGCLLQQLGLSSAQAGDRTGWSYILPALYADDQIRNCDLGQLVNLSQEARAIVRGELKTLSFDTGAMLPMPNAGANLYFLPFVTYAPAGVSQAMPLSSARMVTRMTQWVTATLEPRLGSDLVVHVGQLPQPFSLALRVGARLRMDVRLREVMMRVCSDSGVEPNGLAALVAPYAAQHSADTFMVGVSLVSRLTKNVVATLSLPIETADGEEELALATHILKDLGLRCIEDYHQPIETISCQHCGGIQFAMPTPALVAKNLVMAGANHVH